jgi:hypothetical protein
MSIPDIDWSLEYQRGYNDALTKMINKFQQEYNETAAQDPHFAFYSRYVVDTLQKELGPKIED